jgi:4-hydroxybenzoate polyprenyltransferase
MEASSQVAARATRRGSLAAAVRALRPAEWIKNAFVFAPLIFSGRFDETSPTLDSLALFAAFCAVASAGYLVNDLIDVEHDRQHPQKRTRPIASGELSERTAIAMAAVLVVVGVAIGAGLGWELAAIVAGYGLVALAYSLLLKRVVIVDVMTIGALFLARVLAGGVAIDVTVSDWLTVCTGMLALFLGFAKRRQEAAVELNSGLPTRPVLEHYSLPFLDQMVAMVTAATVISYVIYAIDSPLVGGRMLLTAPPVIYGIFRYLYLIYHRSDDRGTATLLTRDPGMVAAAVVWVGVALLVLYV